MQLLVDLCSVKNIKSTEFNLIVARKRHFKLNCGAKKAFYHNVHVFHFQEAVEEEAKEEVEAEEEQPEAEGETVPAEGETGEHPEGETAGTEE